jgi:hypothetical protein
MNGQTAGKRPSAQPTRKRADASGVGTYVDAACGKCKSVTSHIVLAKLGDKPTRVECRTCHAMHAYRLPGVKKASAASRALPKATPAETWAARMRQAKGEAVPYLPGGHYAVGSRLSHPSFGEGVVARQTSATVCEVIFAERTVKLLMSLDNSRG